MKKGDWVVAYRSISVPAAVKTYAAFLLPYAEIDFKTSRGEDR